MGRSVRAVFDTNILIDHLRDVPAATAELQLYGRESKSISLITWIEVMAGATASNEGVTRGLLDEFLVLSITEDIAERSAVIRRDRRIKLPDAIIWATAQVSACVLVTRNTRDFPPDQVSVRVPYVL
jgi:predicted nucleic acid-binding protein